MKTVSKEVPFAFVELHIREREEKRRSLGIINRMDLVEPCEINFGHRYPAR